MKFLLKTWQKTGGVMIISNEMFRTFAKKGGKKIVDQTTQNVLLKCLIDPGPDVVVCNLAHLMKKI